MLRIAGFQKTTLIDYPGEVASLIFTPGCNMRCPYCHNKSLVLLEYINEEEFIPEDYILSHLKKRKGLITGLCITGGEPTLHTGLYDFIKRVKDIGIKVKLDTNGTSPNVVKTLLDEGLLSYIAMDIKGSFNTYKKFFSDSLTEDKKEALFNDIKETAELIKRSNISHEFRTTVSKNYFFDEDLLFIKELLLGEENYFIQSYRQSDWVIDKNNEKLSRDETDKIIAHLSPYIKNIRVRE